MQRSCVKGEDLASTVCFLPCSASCRIFWFDSTSLLGGNPPLFPINTPRDLMWHAWLLAAAAYPVELSSTRERTGWSALSLERSERTKVEGMNCRYP
jgi:hypothetical protein